jgi:cell wall-associated NlpC family hydrolase
VPWQVLAAVNSVETNFGRDLSVSSAGAEGWMQFMPETWAQWGVDANHDGKKDPYDPRDAIFAAARYLRANGAPRDIRRAIFAYNHANWYVDEVLQRAQWIQDTAGVEVRGTAGARIKKMRAMADSLLGLPYVWGGGHTDFARLSGYDCSGFVSAVLHSAGYLSAPQTTDTMPGQPGIKPGPGRYVTIFDRTGADGHVIIDINGQFYESGGSAFGGGGAGVKKMQPPLSYLTTFNTILHPEGL